MSSFLREHQPTFSTLNSDSDRNVSNSRAPSHIQNVTTTPRFCSEFLSSWPLPARRILHSCCTGCNYRRFSFRFPIFHRPMCSSLSFGLARRLLSHLHRFTLLWQLDDVLGNSGILSHHLPELGHFAQPPMLLRFTLMPSTVGQQCNSVKLTTTPNPQGRTLALQLSDILFCCLRRTS